MAAVIALVHMAAENRCAAVFDGVENAVVVVVEQVAEVIEKLFSVSPDNIGHLEARSARHSPGRAAANRLSSGLAVLRICRSET